MKRLLLNLLLVAVSSGIALGGAEIAFRLAGYRAIYEIYSTPWVFWRYDPVLGWSHEPHATGTFVGPRPWPIEFSSPVKINSLGLRGPELAEKPAGGVRVLALGDSVVAGFEVPDDRTFAALLGPLVEQRIGRPVQVVNAGVRGYGTDQSYLYYTERGRELRPDLVFFLHSGNDAAENRTLHEMRRPFGKPAFAFGPDGTLRLVGSPVPDYPLCSYVRLVDDREIARVDGVLSDAICTAQRLAFDHSALFAFVTLRVPWDYNLLKKLYYLGVPDARSEATKVASDPLATRLVVDLAKAVRADGAGFFVYGGEFFLRTLDPGVLAQEGVDVVPLSDARWITRREILFRNDSHFNEQGHRELAEFLAPLIAERLR
jgi:lysophospholipase L1-like esterase